MYYHGSSTAANIKHMLLPPVQSGVISETTRKKNLDRVFFTKDKKLASIYAGRACRAYGGKPVVYRVISPVDTQELSAVQGATVFHAQWAFVERIN